MLHFKNKIILNSNILYIRICIIVQLNVPSVLKKQLTSMKKSVKLTYKDDIMSQTYDSLRKYGDLRAVHVPHSTVHYIRALIQRDTGVRYSLSRVENAMKAEGWHE